LTYRQGAETFFMVKNNSHLDFSKMTDSSKRPDSSKRFNVVSNESCRLSYKQKLSLGNKYTLVVIELHTKMLEFL